MPTFSAHDVSMIADSICCAHPVKIYVVLLLVRMRKNKPLAWITLAALIVLGVAVSSASAGDPLLPVKIIIGILIGFLAAVLLYIYTQK